MRAFFLTLLLLLPHGESAAQGFSSETEAMRLFFAATIGRTVEVRKERAEEVLSTVEDELRTQPASVEFHLLKVAALGALARASGFKDSLANRYGSKSGEAVEALLNNAPNEPWARALSGIWNLEVQRRGGGIGSFLLGASVDRGLADLEKARLQLPEDAAVPFAFAITLLSLDAREYSLQAQDLLAEAFELAADEPDDPVSEPILAQAQQLIELLQSGNDDQANEKAVNLM